MLVLRNGLPRRARLVAVGSYVPERVLTNADLEEMVDTSDEWIVARTGIRERRVAAPDQAASDLGILAARDVLAAAGMDGADVEAVICATSTGDYVFPPTAPMISLGIGATRALAFDTNIACAGWIYGLSQATALIESGQVRNALLVGAEVMTRFVDFTDRATCVLFGDGSGAALLVADDDEATTGFLGFDLGTDATKVHELKIPVGGGRSPYHLSGTVETPDVCIQMNGREVFKFATRIMIESVTRLLDGLEMSADEIDLFVAHQANSRIIDYAMDKLGIPPEKTFANVERYGNTSAASIPIAMREARDRGVLTPGDVVLMVGFGAGLSWGSTVVRYEPRPVGA
ncbi:MAG: beta-ketoacyl-ACP synthase III [Actinomycetota bacterium]